MNILLTSSTSSLAPATTKLPPFSDQTLAANPRELELKRIHTSWDPAERNGAREFPCNFLVHGWFLQTRRAVSYPLLCLPQFAGLMAPVPLHGHHLPVTDPLLSLVSNAAIIVCPPKFCPLEMSILLLSLTRQGDRARFLVTRAKTDPFSKKSSRVLKFMNIQL